MYAKGLFFPLVQILNAECGNRRLGRKTTEYRLLQLDGSAPSI
jgi:hypothetical protein